MEAFEFKTSQRKKKTISGHDLLLENQLRRIKHKLLIMSGKDGVGKSNMAAAISLGLAKLGSRVGLLDIDLHGPSIPHLFGIAGPLEVDQKRRILPHVYNSNLHIVSIECLFDDRDSSIIRRGPIKHGVRSHNTRRSISQLIPENPNSGIVKIEVRKGARGHVGLHKRRLPPTTNQRQQTD